MSCVEKRHMSHRVGSMLHHRFPNGFTDLLMDETDREVSTLTDRAFRSLCVGDDAVYNDEFLYGYSPFNCHKPLAGEPPKKTHQKETKKQGQNKKDKNDLQPWKKQQQQNISNMSSFLKAFSATEESCEGLLIKNGGMMDSNGESWDKSALRSIQRELSEFSPDYNTNLTERHNNNGHRHHSGGGSSNKTGKDAAPPSGKSSKSKNGKTAAKLRKLNIKNFFLHSEFSPFQTWRDMNRLPFGQEEMVTTILPTDNISKWYDLSFYKELADAHRQETLHTEEAQSCQKVAVEPPPPVAPKPKPPPPPPKVLPKPSATPAEKRCTSDGGNGIAAPWRRNRSRAKSAIPVNQSGSQDNHSKAVDESPFSVKKEPMSVEVKAIEEVSSVASTPFSICQLMTPLIPSRQPTETSEILSVFSPSALDLPLRPHSEAKGTPEPPVKRDSYKSLASSILFNLKDNRKRVKSRYSPPKFKTADLPEVDNQSPSDHLKHSRAGSEGFASGLSTPAIFKDELTVFSPILEPANSPTAGSAKNDTDRPLSGDYLLSNLLQPKKESVGGSGEENPISPFMRSKKNRSPAGKKQNYPSLNLYKKASNVDGDMKNAQVPVSSGHPENVDHPSGTDDLSVPMENKLLSLTPMSTNTGLSPNTSNISKDQSPMISPHAVDSERLSSHSAGEKRLVNVPDKAKQMVRDTKEKDSGKQLAIKEKETSGQTMSTMDVIRAAREAINAVKTKALLATQQESINKAISDVEEIVERDTERVANPNDKISSTMGSPLPENDILSQSRIESLHDGNNLVKKEPPPVPKRNFAKSDIEFALDKHPNIDITRFDLADTTLDLAAKENTSVTKQAKSKHVFSSRQNNYIKNQRFAVMDDDEVQDYDECDLNVNTRLETEENVTPLREKKDSEHIISDLHALKELQRAKLGDRVLDNARNKFGIINLDAEARAKNDLISRELRNIKKGMMSMRGNTSSKRDVFTKTEKEQRKQETLSKMDGNVLVNKALINDNYDKAKMALEEIISEREKRKNKPTEDFDPVIDDDVNNESYVIRVQQCQNAKNDFVMDDNEKQNGSISAIRDRELKERLSDLRDHNHVKQILSQTEPRLGETHRLGGNIVGMERVNGEQDSPPKIKHDKQPAPHFDPEEVDFKHVSRQISEDSSESVNYEIRGIGLDAPPVPPRSKKASNERDGSVTKELGISNGVGDEVAFEKVIKYENGGVLMNNTRGEVSGKQEIESALFPKETESILGHVFSEEDMWDVMKNANSKSFVATSATKYEPITPSEYRQSENSLHLSPKPRADEREMTTKQSLSTKSETTFENTNTKEQEVRKVKRKAPLKPDHLLSTLDDKASKSIAAEEETDKMSKNNEEVSVNTEAVVETPRNIISPLLLVNGVNINQSPPDQASLSSKSSYFSAESALHRNTETESNVYHSLENLIGEVEEDMQNDGNLENTDLEYYHFSDHETDPEVVTQAVTVSQKEVEGPCSDNHKDMDSTAADEGFTHHEKDQAPLSPTSTLSPTLSIPSLFKVKDNTFNGKPKKTIQPWALIGLGGTDRGEDQVKETTELPLVKEMSTCVPISPLAETFKPAEILTHHSPPHLLSPSNLEKEIPKKPLLGQFLTVPQEDDRFSGVSPSSEGMESITASTVDTVDEMGASSGVPVERRVSRVPSERSGSTCSGNESQTGSLKPPVVLPKSEKAVLKAIKLTHRRIKKEEAQNSPHRSSQSSSSKHRHKTDKSEQKSSKGSERKHHHHHESENHHARTSHDASVQPLNEKRGRNGDRDVTEMPHNTPRQGHKSGRGHIQSMDTPPRAETERQGRGSDRHAREKSDRRNYSTERVISNVPVYKAHVNDRPMSDRPFQRSQSIDRYLGERVERRLSADMTANEKLDPRSQRIEKSIMDGLQQRGRAREKAGRDNPLRRSHSIDTYSAESSHPVTLSRQSSQGSQFSRQSSMEHAIVTQSFPMTQRKLLQDPDSGQYFFVDMPVQVKTKTFFDPETGSYVQLPVQPPEGAIPQASPMEVLTTPMVVYHGFVPVPLSPMAQKATIQTAVTEPEQFERRHLERSRQMHCKEGHPYLEPVYGQHDHILGEFKGTEELDCPS